MSLNVSLVLPVQAVGTLWSLPELLVGVFLLAVDGEQTTSLESTFSEELVLPDPPCSGA